ncbi:MAG: hypothetical protein MR430_10920 [Lachnospiraceae bacterium]|nr:hypothetical protein [Lachnospiraceae bacterium]
MMKKLFTTKWNPLDTLFYKLDKAVDGLRESFSQEEADVEDIIAAETSHLKHENEQLKELQYPKVARKTQCGYRCPNKRCGIEIDKELLERYKTKFCPDCGQRVYIPIKSKESDTSEF